MKSYIHSPESIQEMNKIEEIQVGDIILFKPRVKLNLNQKTIMSLQSLLPTKLGTNETIHAAVCVGHDEDDTPILANICGSGLKICTMGKKKFGKNYGADRSLVIYRAGQAAGIQLAKTINKDAKNKIFTYSLVKFLKTLGKKELSPERKSKKERIIYENTFCSLYVVEAMKKAWHDDEYRQFYPNFKSNVSPKQLEHFLSNNDEFMQFCYIGKGTFDILEKSILTHLTRLHTKKDINSKRKHYKMTEAYLSAKKEINNKDYSESELKKCICLLSHIMPTLEQNQKAAFFHSSSYKDIQSISKKIGLDKYSKTKK